MATEELFVQTEISLNLFSLVNRLEAIKGREISIAEIAEETGLSEAGLRKAKRGVYGGVQFDTIGKLMDYFNREGLSVGIGDMFVVEKTEGKALPVQVEPAGVVLGA